MSTRAVGLGPALRKAALSPRIARTPANVRSLLLKRSIQTESIQAADSAGILNKQRLARPSSPHFTIYQPQLTWIGSIANRVTGSALSVLLYGFSLAYLVAPGTFDSTHVIEFVGSMPDAVKYAGKAILAAPFAFHSWNGLRHLSWDMGKLLTVKAAYSSGYAVLGATAISTVALVFM
ncbi:cytochrome b subunit of succinate dehydrogenase, Sdh3p [Athelia psychrophila]|uniref:Cytochrome b subunit of succinate dehydrogenase, Sdh3p n=1 Tax=Athelia psychrophila TaxID=1759441 RepID=A0A166L5X9_9AGAM|nr:cytochrome b subunit of succinate dehydrogenase, Sdh3p [Fibularhizoctonia sp. CBS 109695]